MARVCATHLYSLMKAAWSKSSLEETPFLNRLSQRKVRRPKWRASTRLATATATARLSSSWLLLYSCSGIFMIFVTDTLLETED